MINCTASASAKKSAWNQFRKIQNYCLKNLQCIRRDWRLFLMRKLSRFIIVRDAVQRLNRLIHPFHISGKEESSLFPALHVEEAVAIMQRDGFYLGLELPAETVQEILEFAHSAPCYGNRDLNYPFYYHDQAEAEAKFEQQFHCATYGDRFCPAINTIINDPKIQALAACYLGAAPVYVASELSWSFPVAATWSQKLKMAQVLHCDLDDYRCFKLFFYLKETDRSNGAHVSIRGSHRRKTFLHQLLGQRCASIPDEKLIQTYGAENVVTVCGKAGFGFAEDPYCFHKGELPEQGDRLLLQVEYVMKDYGNLRGGC